MAELTTYLPTYKVGPDEIVMRMTHQQFKEINQGLKMIEQKNKTNRNRYVSVHGNEPRQIKPSLRLADPIDTTTR